MVIAKDEPLNERTVSTSKVRLVSFKIDRKIWEDFCDFIPLSSNPTKKIKEYIERFVFEQRLVRKNGKPKE